MAAVAVLCVGRAAHDRHRRRLFLPGISQPGKPVWGYNGSGRAGAKASDQALRAKGLTEIGNSIHAVTVPGAVDAWEAILKAHGRFGLDRALAPAIKYAEGGFPVSARVASGTGRGMSASSRRIPGRPGIICSTVRAPKEGDVIRFPALAATLKVIAAKGARAFYEGEIAAMTWRKRSRRVALPHGGRFRAPSWRCGRRRFRPTIAGSTWLEIPPNGQGLTALVMLNILENFDVGLARSARRRPVSSGA